MMRTARIHVRPSTLYVGWTSRAVESRSNSPSTLCGNHDRFTLWRGSLNVQVVDAGELPTAEFPLATRHQLSLAREQRLPDDVPNPRLNAHPSYKRDLDLLRASSQYDEDGVNPMFLSDLWLRLSDAYRQHVAGYGRNEASMRRGVDQVLDLVSLRSVSKTSISINCLENDIYLPYSPVGPNNVAKVDALIAVAVKYVDSEVPSEDLHRELSLLKPSPTNGYQKVALIHLAVEYKLLEILRGTNQTIMDLVAACRFAGYVGLYGVTLYGCYVSGLFDQLFSAIVVPAGEALIIKSYDVRHITNYCDFVRLYVLFAEICDRGHAQFEGKTIDGPSVKLRQYWKTLSGMGGGQPQGTGGHAGSSDASTGNAFKTPPRKRKNSGGDEESEFSPRTPPPVFAIDGKNPQILHPTPIRDSPLPSFLAHMDSGVAFGDLLASKGNNGEVGDENETELF
ncbi:hypothetical protein PENSPDRAFT_733326 [Peniophora sp. CONT]|nr:hypothetical protein PENSPDRAFT_733326 [Peniophora sp. CONT]